MKAVHRQKYFLEVIQSDTNIDILTLDMKSGEIDSLRMIIIKLTSTKYPNLPLFLLIDKHFWCLQVYHFHLIPYIEE